MSAALKYGDNTATFEVTSGHRRKAELLASDSSIHRHGDRQPERDYYSISMHREDCGGGYVARLMTWDMEQEFRARYTKHDPDSIWSYTAPVGAKEVY